MFLRPHRLRCPTFCSLTQFAPKHRPLPLARLPSSSTGRGRLASKLFARGLITLRCREFHLAHEKKEKPHCVRLFFLSSCTDLDTHTILVGCNDCFAFIGIPYFYFNRLTAIRSNNRFLFLIFSFFTNQIQGKLT